MKPQEFIDKWLEWAKNKKEINDEILADLEAMNQALRIHDVVGKSEQFICHDCGKDTVEWSDELCEDCTLKGFK